MTKGEDIDTTKESGRVRSPEELSAILGAYVSGISYEAVRIEVPPPSLFPELSEKIVHTIKPIASLDIAAEVKTSKEKCSDKPTFILIPGRAFDATGTRHGKGAGWYDRYLSAVPREWLRIGLCYETQFSTTPLIRESWDEPMDFVCVVPFPL